MSDSVCGKREKEEADTNPDSDGDDTGETRPETSDGKDTENSENRGEKSEGVARQAAKDYWDAVKAERERVKTEKARVADDNAYKVAVAQGRT